MEKTVEPGPDIDDVDSHLRKAIKNLNEDRAITGMLLTDVVTSIKGNTLNHKEMGQIAAKYVETLQRSNDQLVRICSLIEKRSVSDGLSEKDKAEIFDIIQDDK
tara:strand:+ start:240 stop:551 length:312 start_codon:yes stop_codon:yes gene_type:complete